jgi:hypothetical protein
MEINKVWKVMPGDTIVFKDGEKEITATVNAKTGSLGPVAVEHAGKTHFYVSYHEILEHIPKA